jgi:hypothetical protein
MITNYAKLGVEAGELAKTFVAHGERAPAAFCRSIWAIYGVASPLGRLADKHYVLNSATCLVLRCDFLWLGEENGLWSYTAPEAAHFISGDMKYPIPTVAAQAMMDHGLQRERGKCLSSTPSAEHAMRSYADERVELTSSAILLFTDAAGGRQWTSIKRWILKAEKEREAFEQMLALLPQSGQ